MYKLVYKTHSHVEKMVCSASLLVLWQCENTHLQTFPLHSADTDPNRSWFLHPTEKTKNSHFLKNRDAPASPTALADVSTLQLSVLSSEKLTLMSTPKGTLGLTLISPLKSFWHAGAHFSQPYCVILYTLDSNEDFCRFLRVYWNRPPQHGAHTHQFSTMLGCNRLYGACN